MRKASLLLLILLTGCALRGARPLPPGAFECPRLTPFKALVRYELHVPGKTWRGKLSLLGDAHGHLYFESFTPFGTSLLQGNFLEDCLCAVFFPRQEIFMVRLKLPPALGGALPYLLLGRVPLSWQEHLKRAFARREEILLYFHFESEEAKVSFYRGKLREVLIWKGQRLLFRGIYQQEQGRLKAELKWPSLHSSLRLEFLKWSSAKLPPGFYRLNFSPLFQIRSYKIDLSR